MYYILLQTLRFKLLFYFFFCLLSEVKQLLKSRNTNKEHLIFKHHCVSEEANVVNKNICDV